MHPTDAYAAKSALTGADRAATTRVSPLEEALHHLADRLDRVESVLGGPLVTATNLLETRLEPITAPGALDPGDTVEAAILDDSPAPPRSTIARRILAAADRADSLGDRVLGAAERLRAITDAVEV